MRNTPPTGADPAPLLPGKKSRLHGWAVLVFVLFLLWGFAFVVGPWAQHRIPLMDQIVQIADERDIDMGAYFYTEIEASYNGERYLKGALDLGVPGEAGFTPLFLSGMAVCFILLWLGYRYLPMD